MFVWLWQCFLASSKDLEDVGVEPLNLILLVQYKAVILGFEKSCHKCAIAVPYVCHWYHNLDIIRGGGTSSTYSPWPLFCFFNWVMENFLPPAPSLFRFVLQLTISILWGRHGYWGRVLTNQFTGAWTHYTGTPQGTQIDYMVGCFHTISIE